MRCKTCDYPLWNLPARKCPECGTDFKPSDYHFVPNSVRFLCPHCEQCYYGTTEHGQLIPRTFHCVQCAQRIDMDEMLLFPAEGVEEAGTAADIMPWLQRRQMGWLRGWFRTVGMAMVAPHKLMRAVPIEGGLGEAFFFAFITHALIALLGVCLPLLIVGALFSGRGASAGGTLGMLGNAGGSLVVGPIGVIIVATAWGLLTHGLLKISGDTPRGVGRTLQALFYSSGANLPLAIPCIGPYCGGYFLWIWWLVSAILMVMQAQKASGLRATLCVGAGPAIGILAFAALIVSLFTSFANMNATMGPVATTGYAPTIEARAIGAALLAHASANNGQGPAHAIQLIQSNQLATSNFVIWQVGHLESQVVLPAASVSLDAFQYLLPNRRRMAVQSITQSLPAQVIAHRVGDVVFTYHGMDLRSADSNLWIAIIFADPDQSSGASSIPLTPIAVQADGTAVPLGSNRPMSDWIARQNALRAQYNLRPLPDPSTIRNAAPAAPNP